MKLGMHFSFLSHEFMNKINIQPGTSLPSLLTFSPSRYMSTMFHSQIQPLTDH